MTGTSTSGPAGGSGRHRRLSDERLHQAFERCPDDGTPMVPTGSAYSDGLQPTSPADWFVAFRCPLHPDEILRIWNPGLAPLITEVLTGVDVSTLPVVDAGLR